MQKSWDTSIKLLARLGLLKSILTKEQYAKLPTSNLSRWRHEPEDKYEFSELNELLNQELVTNFDNAVKTYNTIRPQKSLGCNTPLKLTIISA